MTTLLKNCVLSERVFSMNWLRHVYMRTAGSWVSKYYDLTALTHLQSLGLGYQAWTSSSVRPGAMRILLNEIIIHSRKNVIEFGAGISTIYMAKVLSNQGGMLVTVDQDQLWLSKVERMVGKLCLRPGTWRGIHAPLMPSSTSLNHTSWYDEAQLRNAFDAAKFDMCLVDGPHVTHPGGLNRYPAGEFMKQYLADDYTLFLDDVDRESELYIATLWAAKMKAMLMQRIEQGSIALLYPLNAKRYNIF